jgi:hypothetical protein
MTETPGNDPPLKKMHPFKPGHLNLQQVRRNVQGHSLITQRQLLDPTVQVTAALFS